jgi:hypothetical protein
MLTAMLGSVLAASPSSSCWKLAPISATVTCQAAGAGRW